MQERLVIISNRLPVTIDDDQQLRQSSGGLVSAIRSFFSGRGEDVFSKTIWAGVPGCDSGTWEKISGDYKADFEYFPLFPDPSDYDTYYSGFSNSVIWPLFHYFPSFVEYNPAFFESYEAVNELFADGLAGMLQSTDTVWIHDYHLMPLAARLRERIPGLTIGFFLHIPFPSYELFRVLPKKWQHALLAGMLGADLIGFQTDDYTRHFLVCLEKTLKVDFSGRQINWDGRKVQVDTFPISIDYDLFHNAYESEEVIKAREDFADLRTGGKLIFSVDRLDYSKGILNRLRGYELFLRDNPEYIGKVQFALVIVPSRDLITKYAERKKIIDEFIGNFNSKFGSIQWQPILYHYNHLSFSELIALYTSCDIALITPLRDGMNLVSKEFVASRKDQRGVLILSEMAGAACELQEALLINPNDSREIADRIKTAFEMPRHEQQSRLAAMQQRISSYSVDRWADEFLGRLAGISQEDKPQLPVFLHSFIRFEIIESYTSASRRLILLDYDGSLVPFSPVPDDAVPGIELTGLLRQLCESPQNDVYIISGRDSFFLEKYFGDLPLNLIAEHGAKMKVGQNDWRAKESTGDTTWWGKVKQVLARYVENCPGSFLEEKDFSLAWHYRNVPGDAGGKFAGELYRELINLREKKSWNVLNGNKVIEIRSQGISKGHAVRHLLGADKYDFILAVGDDITDEDMFSSLAGMEQAFTIKVGSSPTYARYNVYTPYMVQSLLGNIAQYTPATA